MRISIITLLITVFVSCSSDKKANDQEFLKSLETSEEKTGIDEGVINSILEQIPSPLEISVLLKESGAKFNPDILNKSENLSQYNNNFKKALNLGVYGTDLGYTNIYGQNMAGIKYISSIKSLADELSIGQFFDMETIGRLAGNSKNLDSLLLITTLNFNHINHYLQTQGRDNLSVLLLTGGWVEAMQITCQAAAVKPSKELFEKIGEQKIILEQIVLLFSFYTDDENMTELAKELEQLKTAYDKIAITYTYKESTMEVVNDIAVIKDNSTTTIDITDQHVEEISSLVNSIRTKITG
ncbi:MAG: hypothetical protein RI909_766 [Bacteroidota bacterium]|jgi:hypothetical protein